MFAFVPGKDVLLFLAKIQKKIISVFNSNRPAKFFAAPVFPLWAFFEFAFPEKIINIICKNRCTSTCSSDRTSIFMCQFFS